MAFHKISWEYLDLRTFDLYTFHEPVSWTAKMGFYALARI